MKTNPIATASQIPVSVDEAIEFLVNGYRASLEDDAEFVKDELVKQIQTKVVVNEDDDELVIYTLARGAYLPPELVGYDTRISNALFALRGKNVILIDPTDNSRKSSKLICKNSPDYKLGTSSFTVMDVWSVYGTEITLKPEVNFEQEEADLLKAHQQVADAALADFECDGFQEADGWCVDGDNWSCCYYYTNPDDPDGDSLKSSFGVEFLPDSTEISNRWC